MLGPQVSFPFLTFYPDQETEKASWLTKEFFGCASSFAMMEMNLILAKMLWRFDMELVDKELDWEGESHMHVMWWKPDLKVTFRDRVDRF